MGSVVWRAQSDSSSIIAADGCVDLLWLDDELCIAGPMTTPIWDGPRSAPAVGIRIPPGLGRLVLGGGITELRDQCVAASEVLPRGSLAQLTTVTGRERAFRLFVGRAVTGDRCDWAATVSAAAHAGDTAVAAAQAFALSQRQFRRKMALSFGFGYRTLLGIVRAQTARGHLAKGIAPSDVAALVGFADQSHLTREIRRYTGQTPGQLLAASGA